MARTFGRGGGARNGKVFPVRRALRTPEEVRAYFTGDEIVCLICGRRMSRLSRHLRSAHKIGPEEYRHRYGLPWGRGLVSEGHRRRLAEKLAAQPPRPVPEGRYQGRRRPRQPFEHILTFRALERATPKRPSDREAHEEFLQRLRAGRTVRSVARDPDMPSLAGHYAYRKTHPGYDQRVRRAMRHHRPRGREGSTEREPVGRER